MSFAKSFCFARTRTLKPLIFFLLFASFLNAKPISEFKITPPNYKGKVRFIKQVELNYNFEGFNFSEISDLLYDKKSSTLYMLSDKGILFSFKAKFSDKNFKLTPLSAHYLKNKKGKRLKPWKRDSEGLAMNNKGQLFISFEGKPKISLFRKDGIKIKNVKLPKSLKKAKLRSRNKSLESLSWHPKYGLLTALEYPKKSDSKLKQTIYALNGKKWRLNMEPISNNAISEIEVTDDGNLLVLERAYNGIFGKFEINLIKMYLNGCLPNSFCPKKLILKIDSAKGWTVENFEGLCRVAKNRYLMISDDNDSFLASTVLVYFEIL